MLYYSEMNSPVGKLRLVADDSALVAILTEKEKAGRVPLEPARLAPQHPVLKAAREQLEEYFAGKRQRFDLPLRAAGTAFQQEVWKAMRRIPFGQSRSYGELASTVGRPLASRAVGAACGRNPICIIVPCHRVVGASGKLTGFAGGLGMKAALLELEKRGGKGRG